MPAYHKALMRPVQLGFGPLFAEVPRDRRALFHSDDGCGFSGGKQWTFVQPGDATGGYGTAQQDGPWNDLISSFECSTEIWC